MTYALNTRFNMVEKPQWLSTRQPPVVEAKIVSAVETPRSGVLYGVEFIATKPMNGKLVTVTRLLFEKQLAARITELLPVIEIVKKPRKPRAKAAKTVKRSGSIPA